MIKVRKYNKEDMVAINPTKYHPELYNINMLEYGTWISSVSEYAYTIESDNINTPLMLVALQKAGESRYEGLFVMSEELIDNFIKYGRSVLREINTEIDRLGLDFLGCLCYNSNTRGQKLLKYLGFKFDHKFNADFDYYSRKK